MLRRFLPISAGLFYIRPTADTTAGSWTSSEGAIAYSVMTSGTSTSTSTSFDTGSFTPPNNSLLVAIIHHGDSRTSGWTAPVVSGGSLSWTERESITAAAQWQVGSVIATAPVTTGASMTVTFTSGANAFANGTTYIVYAVTGYNVADPVGLANSSKSTTNPNGAASLSLGGTPASSSFLLGGCGIDAATAEPTDLVLDSAWTDDGYLEASNNWASGRYGKSTGAQTSSLSFSTIVAEYCYTLIAVEIKSGTAALYEAINETSYNDADYIQSAANPSNDLCKIALGDPSVTAGQPMVVRYRIGKSHAAGVLDLRVRLLQGTTEIASWTETNIAQSYTTVERTLSSGEFAAISDFTDLYLEFRANQTG